MAVAADASAAAANAAPSHLYFAPSKFRACIASAVHCAPSSNRLRAGEALRSCVMLPDDIFQHTLNSLDLLCDVLSARLVNRRWARGAEETGLWITAWRQLRDSFAWHLRHCRLHVSFTASIADQSKLEFEMPFIEAGLERL